MNECKQARTKQSTAATMATPCAALLLLSVVLVVFLCFLPPPADSLFFNYSTFSSQDQKDFRIEGEASYSVGRIDISANKFDGGISRSQGRVSYNAQPMLLWDKVTGEVASFTTRFSFIINIPDINNKGKGMAFFLACYPSVLPNDSYGFDLGLTNQSTDATATADDRFVAVEFDTFNDTQVSDPDATYDHIGIDVNSVRSLVTKSLPSFSLMGNMTAIIEYNNVSSVLALTLWLDDAKGRPTYSLSSKVDLKSALPDQVSVGFSAGTSSSVELHQLRSWSFNSSLEPPPPPVAAPPVAVALPLPSRGSQSSAGVIAGAGAGATLFLLLIIAASVILIRRRRRNRKKKKKRDQVVVEEEEDYVGSDGEEEPSSTVEIAMGSTGPRRFPYHELVDATRNFAAEEKLGQGGFGAVYGGQLGGLPVAIKRFSKDSSMQGKKEYTSEINVISKLRHRNLVQLVGWCHGRNELLLVYELMPNRSLDIHLHGGKGGTFLTWPMRMKILLGVGSSLLYLHEEWEQCVVHRDIKPSNVMLDESFGAKLGDFGLARFIDHAVGTQTMTAVSGTPGYVDPQCMITGRASAESDVYSFGVLLLEVACGRKPVRLLDGAGGGLFRLVEWVWDLYGRGGLLDAAVDERLNGEYDKAEVERVMVAGLWCAHPDPSARPSMRAAMAVLQSKEQVLPVLPVSMPVPTYAPLPSGLSISSLSTTTGTTLQSTSYSSGVSSSGSKDSSSLLKHQYP